MKAVGSTPVHRPVLLRLFAVASLLLLALALAARAQTPGTVDASFNAGEGPDSSVNTVDVGSNGQIIIRGDFYDVDGVAIPGLARLNTDGSLDTSYDPDQSGENSGGIYSSAVQSDGKLVIGGSFTQFDDAIREYVARLNADGSLDTTFNTSSGANDVVESVALQSDGKIIVGGNFYQFQGENRYHVARLNSDGTLDDSFDPGVGADGDVNFVVVQSDGKVVIGGNFANVDGTARNGLAQLNADGTLDTSFDPGTFQNGSLYSLAVQADGKVLAGGQFTTVDGAARNNLARLNTNGSLDSSFDPGAGPNDIVHALAVQQDGKVVIGGAFTEVNNTARNRIAQLNTDGSLDTDFQPGSGPNAEVDAVTVQSDGKIYIGGQFTIVNGATYNYIARLYGEPVPAITSATAASAATGNAFSYQITATNNPASYNATGLPAGLSVNKTTGLISGTPASTAAGTKIIHLTATNADGTGAATLTLTVSKPTPSITSATTATAEQGKAFSYQITASNGPASFGATGLPSGLSVNAKTGVISGTTASTATGTKTITLKATNSAGTGTATLTLTIINIPAITSATTASATAGQPFSYQIAAKYDPTSFNATGLPSGLSVNKTTGVISGTPASTASGTKTLDLSASNAAGTGTATLTLTISK